MNDESREKYEAAGLRIYPTCEACVANTVPHGWGQCRKHDFPIPPGASCPDFVAREDAFNALGGFRDFLVDGKAKEEKA